jgi:hypothetical protein
VNKISTSPTPEVLATGNQMGWKHMKVVKYNMQAKMNLHLTHVIFKVFLISFIPVGYKKFMFYVFVEPGLNTPRKTIS